MKKIVYESLQEYKIANGQLNEEGMWQRAKEKMTSIGNKILDSFKKVQGYFIALFNGDPVKGVLPPINIGVMVQNGSLPSNTITYWPSPEDKELDPSLPTPTVKDLADKRTFGVEENPGGDGHIERTLNQIAAKMNESKKTHKGKKINEARVPLDHPNADIMNVNTEELMEEIEMAMEMGEESKLLIWGAPGIGKTQIVNAVLKKRPGLRLIDIITSQMAPEDWQMPAVKEVRDGWFVAMDIPKEWLPVYKPSGDPEEDSKRNNIANMGDETTEGLGGIIFFDELSRAHPKVQNSCLKIIDERKIGGDILGDKWIIMSAANRTVDDPDSQITFGNALSNRMYHINFQPDLKSWLQWGFGKVDQRILDYLEFNKDDFYTLDDEDTMGEARIFASPRSWAKASKNLEAAMRLASSKGISRLDRSKLIRAISKDVGVAVAERITAFIKLIEDFRPEEIKMIFTDPTKVKLPKKAGSGFSLSDAHALLSAAILSKKGQTLTPEEFENFATYLALLDNSSIASSSMKNIFKYHPYMHSELGEGGRTDKAKYKKGWDIFDDHYKDVF